ncbi:MAG TPA: HIRAN domain-containing protein [Polyangiaceae bacterium]
MTSSYEPPALFVNWQDESSRRIFPVGRLVTLKGEGYEFAYIAAAREAQEFGFAPFQAFPDLEQVYRAPELPAFFKNRVLQPGRPDYPLHLKELGLESATATPIDILARSGGRRVTDPLEVFAELVQVGDRLETHFFVRGIRHQVGAEDAVAHLHSGDSLRLKPEPTNEFNGNAHLLVCHDGRSVGYVPDYLVDDLKQLMDHDDSLEVEVVRVNAPPSPSQQRLLCKLSISGTAPRPHRAARFEPISPAAIRLDAQAASAAGLQRRTG